MEYRQINNPPPDLELGTQRSPLEYALVLPEGGIGPDTGVLFWIVPWGMSPTHEYSAEKLMPYLANSADCIVVGATYHDVKVKVGNPEYAPPPGWVQLMHERYGTPLVEDMETIFRDLAARKIMVIEPDPKLTLTARVQGDYLSWGVLPALDNIAILGSVLNEFQVNKRKLILFGSSYGGYVVSMILKFMPNTFSLAIENSGFTAAVPKEMANIEYDNIIRAITSQGVSFPVLQESPWTFKHPGRPGFFKPAFGLIRDLNQLAHFRPSETALYSFHSPEDTIAPYGPKVTYTTFRKSYGETFLKTVLPGDIDGQVFKTMGHGMQASMKGLFNYVVSAREDLTKPREENDFDDATKLTFDCGDHEYAIQYKANNTFSWDLKPLANAG